MTKRSFLEGALFSLIVAIVAHFLYGGLGFCPTDEGYLLSASRRMLDGQVPHRDFISLRPVGTALLHAHLLLWTGDHLLWWSRLFAWFQIAVTAWIWIEIARRHHDGMDTLPVRLGAAVLAFLATAHSFPIMPWNTLDGVFFISLGILFRTGLPGRSHHRLAWLLMGASTVFRQNFVFLLPLLLLAFGDAKKFSAWFFAALPGACYLGAMVALGGFQDMLIQMTSLKGHYFFAAATSLRFFPAPFLQGLICGGIGAASMLFLTRPAMRLFGNILLGVGLFYAAIILPFANPDASIGWFLFALLLIPVLLLIGKDNGLVRLSLLALVVGWSVTISAGHPQPTLISSALVISLACVMVELERRRTGKSTCCFHIALSLTLIMALYSFHRGRIKWIYEDINAEYLTHELSDALPGAKGIYTSPTRHACLKDLTTLTASLRAHGKTYSVVPECTQFWVTSPQPNPLSTDWPINEEIMGDQLKSRILGKIDSLKGRCTFVVQKYWVIMISFTREPIRDGELIVVDKIKHEFRKVGETEFFEIYE